MPTLPNLPARYQSRRKDLADQLSQSKSKTATEQLQLALFVTDVTVATLHDISIALQAVASETQAQADQHLQAVDAARSDLEASVANLTHSDGPALEQSFQLLSQMAQLRANSATQGVRIAFLQWDLLSAIGTMWLETLDQLYGASDRAAFFARVEKLLEFAASKVPVVGDILDSA